MIPIGWFRDGRRIAWPRVFLVAFTVVVVLALGVGAAYTIGPFEPYNPTWEGTSEFRTTIVFAEDVSHEGDQLVSAAAYDDLPGNGTVSFVIAPDRPYSESDVDHLESFIDRGGTLVLLDNFGNYSNRLLADLDAQARLDGQVIRDERRYSRGPTMPRATTVVDHKWTTGVEQLSLNLATAVDPHNASMLIGTSQSGYLGALEDEITEDTELQVYPVATYEPMGDGTVVVVSDPSITINEMIEEPDNRAFLEAIVDDADRVVYDMSHAGHVPPLQFALIFLRDAIAVQVLMGIGVILVIILYGMGQPRREQLDRHIPRALGRRLPRWLYQESFETPGLTNAERATLLRTRHPEWSDERIERVLIAMSRNTDDEPSG